MPLEPDCLLAMRLGAELLMLSLESRRVLDCRQERIIHRLHRSEFARRVEDPKVVTINVHVPNEGNIAGTDLTIPFDQVATSTKLPTDLAIPLAVYCRSGNMSAPPVKDLKAKGYTKIVELSGGYGAWLQSGRTLEKP